MATKQTPDPAPESATADVLPTPENTPVPGGGSWHWDETLPGYVENPPYGSSLTTLE